MDSDNQDAKRSVEAQLASAVKAAAEAATHDSPFAIDAASELCSCLELFIPSMLARRYSEWAGESLDAVFVAPARRTGPASVELVGTCILITDQTVTPLWVELTASASGVRIDSFRVCIGESGGGRLGISGPPCNSGRAQALLSTVVDRLDRIVWSYRIVGDGSFVAVRKSADVTPDHDPTT